MANTLLFNPFIQVVNANGKPYAGAKLYTYQAGTTTPLTSYANSNLTTPHANPVIADANGTFPAIYLQKQSYKLRLETSAGVLIDETDNVDSTESAVEQYVNSLLQTTVTEIIGDLYAGAPYRTTNAGSDVSQIFSVKSNVTSSDIGLNTSGNNLDINFSFVNTNNQNIRNAYITTVSTSKTAGSETGDIVIGSRSGYFGVETNSTERLRVTSAGNVGIGTASPATKLDVNGDVTITGSVGIGTTSPSAPLHIQTSEASRIRVQSTAPAERTDFITVNSSNVVTSVYGHNGTNAEIDYRVGNLQFKYIGVTQATLSTTGQLGLGTAPAEQLHITGNFRIGSAVQSTPNGSAPLYAARAWINFNGTGVVAIRASGNVSSITDNGVGDYIVNFTTAMPDANYGVALASTGEGGSKDGSISIKQGTTLTTTSINLWASNYSGGANDVVYACVSIFR